jgi:dTDP-glucose 4,6-dehydratase
MYSPKCVLVTGGCGFIASNFLLHMVPKYTDIHFINVDKLDYCSTINGLGQLVNCRNYWFYPTNISNTSFIEYILNHHKVDTIIHFAAQSHVDNSFGNSICFTQDNVLGTHYLLETTRKYGGIKRFIHVSTDEVYGEVSMNETSSEKSLLNPTNPYAASKAAAEFIVKSYYKSYNIPTIITRGNNVYGPGQYPEKLIPKFILQLLGDKKMTIHGNGSNIRNFIYVEDVARAFEKILFNGVVSEIYNIGTENEHSVMDIAKRLHASLDVKKPLDECINYVDDRLFNDFRYCVDSNKLVELGWNTEMGFEEGLKRTIEWYRNLDVKNYFVTPPSL